MSRFFSARKTPIKRTSFISQVQVEGQGSLEKDVKLRAVVDYFSDSSLELPQAEGSGATRPLDDWEKMYLSKETISRFMTNRWDVDRTIQKLKDDIVWRRTMGMYDIEARARELAPELESGSILPIGYTRTLQPILYSWPSKAKGPPTDAQFRYMMFMAERAVDMMPAGVQELLFCADLSGSMQMKSGAISVYQKVLNGLQTHYPLRLGGAGLLNVNWMGNLLVNCLWPFINAETKEKVHMNPDLSERLVDEDQLLEMYGGTLKCDDPSEYMASLVQTCLRRRKENLQRWKAAGGIVGLSEWEFLPAFNGVEEKSAIGDGSFSERTVECS